MSKEDLEVIKELILTIKGEKYSRSIENMT